MATRGLAKNMGRGKKIDRLQVEIVHTSDEGMGRLRRALDIVLGAARRAEAGREAEEAEAKPPARTHAPFGESAAPDVEDFT